MQGKVQHMHSAVYIVYKNAKLSEAKVLTLHYAGSVNRLACVYTYCRWFCVQKI